MVTVESKLLTPQEAAALVRVKPQTLAAWRCNARYGLPFVRIGRSIRYRREDLDRWLASRTVGAVAAE